MDAVLAETSIGITELLPSIPFFATGKSQVHEHQNREHHQRNERRPLEQEACHDQYETDVLRVPYASVGSGRCESVSALRCIKYLPRRREEPEAQDDQDIAENVEWPEMWVAPPPEYDLQ